MMRYLTILVLLAAGRAAAAVPEFVAVLTSQGMAYVALRTDPSGGSQWVKVGDQIGEFRVEAYDAVAERLVLRQGKNEVELFLHPARVQPTPTIQLLELLVRAGDAELELSLQQARQLDERRKLTAADLARAESQRTDGRDDPGVINLRRRLQIEDDNWEYFLRALHDHARRKAAGVR